MRSGKILGMLLLFCLILAGCSSISNPSSTASQASNAQSWPMPQTYVGPTNRPVATTGCGRTSPITPGSSANVTIPVNPAISEGQYTRMFRVHVPAHYNPNANIPVVLDFHGATGTAVGTESGSDFSGLADQQNFLVVYPQGLINADSGGTFWASDGPIDFGIDDVAFTSNILDYLQKTFCVDPYRIYATGFSNGGGMTRFLMCRLAGRIAAFAPMSGGFYNSPGGCHPGRPVSILDFHGSADPLLPYNGVSIQRNPAWPLPSIPQWLQQWATYDGCTTGPVVFYHHAPVVGEQWTHCKDNVSVEHYRIDGGGHAGPPPINGQSSAVVIWHFFQQYTLPL
jgi:polyhydroxybutyrate depolymerase